MKTLSKFLVGAPLSLVTLLAAGCPTPVVTDDTGAIGNDSGPMGDAGPMRDTGARRDTGAPVALATCSMPRMVTLAAGAPMTVTGSTAGGGEGPLATECGNTMAATTAPQEVIAVQIPGTAPSVLTFSMGDGTDATFDTIVEVRNDCAMQGECFDDIDGTTTRSGGSVRVMGGQTVYLVVSGFAEGMFMGSPTMGEGAYSLTLQADPLVDLATCAAPRTVTLTAGAPSVVMGDMSRGVPGPIDLGEDCFGGPEVMPADRLPQDVVAVTIPGSGMVNVAFDLTSDSAQAGLVQVRSTCATVPSPLHTCFTNGTAMGAANSGAFVAMGGSTVFLVVSTQPASTYELTIQTVATNAAPTLTAGTAVRVGRDTFRLNLTGGDTDSNVTGYRLELLNAAGMPISLSETETRLGPIELEFDEVPTMATFMNQASTLNGSGRVPVIGRAVSARVSVVDRFGLTSAPLTIAITDVGGLGQPCDGTTCAGALVCMTGTCAATPAATAACAGATAVTLTAPTATTPSVNTQSVMLTMAASALEGSCGVAMAGSGAERVFNVTVPAGNFDLVATTNVMATAGTVDTVVYVRANCTNDASELTCNDDYTGAPDGDLRSTATVQNVPAGTHTIVVDTFAALTAPATVGAEFRLRAVVAAGAACDPMGIANRCATSACPTMGAAVCPAM
jgi:hypothetical protein